MMSHSTTSHSTRRLCILSYNTNKTNALNQPTSIEIPLRKPQLPSPSLESIQITPIPAQNTCSRRRKNSNLDVIRLMDTLNHPIPLDMYSSFLSECTRNSDSVEALHLHNHLIRHRDLTLDSPLVNRLLYTHLSCGQLDIARKLFDKMPLKKNVLFWAIIIMGYLENAQHEEGISLFVKMLFQHNVSSVLLEFPIWVVLFVGVLKACLHCSNLGLGKQLHGILLKVGGTNDFSMSFSLMDFYGKFGCLEDANSVFNQIWCHDTEIWTVKIVNT